jgi:hypothetical protein
MSRRTIVWACVPLTVAVLVALAVAVVRTQPVRTYALGAPNYLTIAHLRPGTRVCEGPATSDGPAGLVGVWGAPTSGSASLVVTARDAVTHRTLAAGELVAATGSGEHVVRLARAVPGGHRVEICLTGRQGHFALAGSASIDPRVRMTGGEGGAQFALVLLNDRRSLWQWLGTAFSRASLWRLSWVGSWTFWVLAFALLACFGAAVVAVARAAAEDDSR